MKIEAKRVSKRHPNRTKKPPESSLKKHRKKERFWESGGAPPIPPGITPKQGTCPQKSSPTTHKTTQDPNKITTPTACPNTPGCLRPGADLFVILGGFGVVWGVILGAKWRPKWLQNLIKKMSDFWIALGSALGRQRAG